ncbi:MULTISPECIES: TonB-dependent receptor [unclassified Pseudodesulfovibrio]|uniref:TonB-dependent receptor plug domain-containing protein n=1 Tax=unclassified Pseudodesulfovibrio TaxID=2661612 RepID=UPI000FEBCADA|nr:MULTISPECIES: TonB-dependent receptor [unclassified Pseudodesulfovibrio]MCJ2164548.1 TonB-dependent receptor plug domain-containing protein [Pseudodesulfovibrio sp. S3-i]RWU04746.1 TonB-dependent receptor [Pseudodesulfovibrio sp. S3]
MQTSRIWPVLFIVLVVSLTFGSACASDDEHLATLDLEELMEVEVVTASRRTEPLSQIPGAVMVLTEEDIFRSGATSLPEVLKLVPGVHVAQIDTNTWAVGIRGFNGLLSNKHLVLVDGRPITSPVMNGVQWGNTVPLSLIKRIEVVRGTRTSLWGAESFTGVINVITKTAAEVRGGQSVTQVGTTGVEQTVRQGSEIGENADLMVYGNGVYKSGNWLSNEEGDRSGREWSKFQSGARADWENAFTDALSLQCNLTGTHVNEGTGGPDKAGPKGSRDDINGYGQFVWDRATGLDSNLHFRTSYTRETARLADMEGGTNVLDAEFTSAMEQAGRHRLTWGIGSQYFWDDMSGGDNTSIDRQRIYTLTANGFIRDRITLVPESLYLILGSKVDYLGEPVLEVQPTVRMLYTREDSEYWLAVSRGVRADTRYQRSGSYTFDHRGTRYTVVAPGDLKTEKLISYEAGYRQALTPNARLDVSLYVNDYSELIMLDIDDVNHTATLDNSLKGTAYGFESLFEWKATDWLTLQPSVSIIYQNIYGSDSSLAGDSMPEEGLGSEVKLQVMTTPMPDVGVDVQLGYIDSPDQHRLPGYFSLDGHVSWRASDTLLLELIGKNLAGSHEQFSDLAVGPSLDCRITWDF